ncbi:excinuclease ABC subunit B [candidate division WOR-1 bacterium RIFOXYA12_FULL_43_27]|uniref:UvrABC system protein B n=1 Tax=candidate division WOR-1 bacterium RIFOXYC2_FULL_46_14 TaxID=1802587 RepID=A0A1F4U835_UNCSA|nr:MAG: excinuclease ABC subunit B [candidate division WOR-1 bacterium RIFOXYA12_FULL_43_27]OGC19421.1 MAG: excinuclease ABC subunit B [candidate division WOR-1 bacterium RIFOXYB2_FULL_46_45]OGC30410.1 MAG: excinuclease ABC subunit B [candidate division WOR-1 bacterium RIFOXYA2_FULL_46_56]OGC41010.1 MAG: excinuclease ABC subunit B [candidate division WOR-1 bacterium RIFOXYC2_FULL_46_14]
MTEKFKLVSDFKPAGDQPRAIRNLVKGLDAGYDFQTLLGVTGSGKTFTMANVIAKVQKPTLIISHNKTLAAQLCQEFRSFFPENAVEYFVSYYDYYQPEAYIPQTDTYIAKESTINQEIDRLRHSATMALISRRDVIVVASVSCIYGLGTPKDYLSAMVSLEVGKKYDRDDILRRLVEIKYERNDFELNRGKFRARGETIEIHPAYEKELLRIEFDGDKIKKISEINPTTRNLVRPRTEAMIFPATHFVTFRSRIETALQSIQREMEEWSATLKEKNKLLEAQRITQRTKYDMEMIREIGYCQGIENYSRPMDGRAPGTPPATLLDYFPEDFLLFIDESHVTVPQIGGMYFGDKARKDNLIDFGFRLPSARDNRPLKFAEFEKRLNQVIFVSATPSKYEAAHQKQVVEQIIRPTGLIDPEVIVKPAKDQVEDLMKEVAATVKRGERVLITTLTKRLAEDLSDYLDRNGIKVRYLHSDVETLNRIDILRGLRTGEFDVLVGINLLREGLDLPEVSLVAILDADKEGFLRAETSLIQTIGRAARNINGKVILYADKETESMRKALFETNRRRKIQLAYNKKHKITPKTVQKEIHDISEQIGRSRLDEIKKIRELVPKAELPQIIRELEEEMEVAATELEFEKAALLRDQISELKKAFKI